MRTRIMVVEDEAIVALDLRHRLGALGCDVVAAVASSEEALQSLAAAQPELALVDIYLRGGMDGIALGAELRRQGLPVIYLTAYADDRTLERARTTCPQGYLVKPVRNQELGIALQMAVSRAALEGRLRQSEERYRGLVELSPEAIIVHADGRLVFANLAAVVMMGADDAGDLLGKPALDFVHPDCRRLAVERIRKVRESGEKAPLVEERFIRLDGAVIDVEVTAIPFTYEGRPAVQVVARDITARKQAEAALQESEERHRLIFENSLDAVLLTAPDGKIFAANAAASQMFGRTEEEICALGRNGVLDAADPRLEPALDERLRTGRFRGELTGWRRDGTKFPVEISTALFKDRDGRLRTAMVIRDISERQRRETQEKALSGVRDAVWRMQTTGEARTLLEAVQAGLQEMAIPFRACDINVMDRLPGREAPVSHVASAGIWVTPNVEFGAQGAQTILEFWRAGQVVYRRDLQAEDAYQEQEILAAVFGCPIRCVVDVPFSHGTLAVNSEEPNAFSDQDIAFLQQLAEVLSEGYRRLDDLQRLASSEARYRTLVETPDLAVMLMDLEGRYLYVSPQVVRWTGYSPEEFYANPGLGPGMVHPDDLRRLEALGHELLRTGHGERQRFRYLPKGQQEYRWASEIIFPVCDRSGKIEALQAVVQDITEHRQMEEELVRLERLHALGGLAAGISHNLNNILTGVIAPAQLIKRTTRDPQILREVEDILTSARHARDLVQRLNQGVRGQPAEALEPVPVESVVHQVVQAARPRWQDEAQSEGVAIEVVTSLEPVPPVQGTRSGLHEVLLNMFLNAVDAMPRGGTITLRTWTAAEQVHLSIQDTGMGMDQEVRRRVFEPFFTTKARVGTGLGLSSAYGTVKGWGGDIQVQSAPGEGSIFTLCLPVWEQAQQVAGGDEVADALAQRGRVLIVEDERPVRELLERLISVEHEVEVAVDGQQALARFSPGRYDVVLLDLGLPGKPGDQVAREMQGVDPMAVLVVVSGWKPTADDPRRQVFDFSLGKPFMLEEVTGVVRQAMGLRHARAQGKR